MKMNRIKDVVENSKFNQATLAHHIGLSKNAVSLFCRNESQPKMETLFKIAKALNVSPRELLTEPDWSEASETDFEAKPAKEKAAAV